MAKGLSMVISTGTEEKMVMLGVLTQTEVKLEMPAKDFRSRKNSVSVPEGGICIFRVLKRTSTGDTTRLHYQRQG